MASDLSGAPPAGSPADAPSWSSEDTTPREIAGALARLSEHRDGGRGRAYAPARALSLVTVADRGRSDELVSRLDRRMAFGVSINDCELYISIGDVNLTGRVERLVP